MKTLYIFSITAITILFITNPIIGQDYLDSSLSDSARALDLLSLMTKEEKVGQMIQAERGVIARNPNMISTYFFGSVLSGGGSSPSPNTPKGWADMYNSFQGYALKTRLKIPIIYGIDAVHGHNSLYGSTIFPHNIGMGCTRDTLLMRRCAEITSLEVAATGIDWTFSPCIAVVRDIRWGRTYEGFGETPEIVSPMAKAAVAGYQNGKYPIMACAKHFLADGGTTGGDDRGNSNYTEEELRKIFLPPYIEAVNAGVSSVMVSFSSWNNTKMHSHKYLITDVLKGELGFKGLVVSDWAGIDYIDNDYKVSVEKAINAGIDMIMEPTAPEESYSTLLSLVNSGKVSMERIDDAVMRILLQKFRFKLFEQPYADSTLLDKVGTPENRAVAREAVRKSLVLLKNQGILPIKKDVSKIFVGGTLHNDLGSQCGGWTMTWQGGTGNITKGTTLLQAVKEVAINSSIISSNFAKDATGADVAIVVTGETPYAEWYGDNKTLALPTADVTLISDLKKSGVPVVVILYSGRPVIVENIIKNTNAFIVAWWPGTEGRGITDVLFGDYKPKGKLSYSWPRSVSQLPLNYPNYSTYDPRFGFDYGADDWGIVTSVEENNQADGLVIYPNPSNDLFNITINSDMKNADIDIFDNTGRLVYCVRDINITPWNIIQITTGEFGKGVFQVVISNKKDIYRKKILVR